MPKSIFDPPKKKTVIRKKIKNIPPWTGTKDEMWAVKSRETQDRANKRRDKLIEAAKKREKLKRSKRKK